MSIQAYDGCIIMSSLQGMLVLLLSLQVETSTFINWHHLVAFLQNVPSCRLDILTKPLQVSFIFLQQWPQVCLIAHVCQVGNLSLCDMWSNGLFPVNTNQMLVS